LARGGRPGASLSCGRCCPRSPVAQLAEHPAVNRRVVGSSPTRGASKYLLNGETVRAPRWAPSVLLPDLLPDLAGQATEQPLLRPLGRARERDLCRVDVPLCHRRLRVAGPGLDVDGPFRSDTLGADSELGGLTADSVYGVPGLKSGNSPPYSTSAPLDALTSRLSSPSDGQRRRDYLRDRARGRRQRQESTTDSRRGRSTHVRMQLLRLGEGSLRSVR
jgi:hypothetical protein